MTTFTVKFDCYNAAFDEGMATEIGRILRNIAKQVEQDGAGIDSWTTVLDSNGNDIGRFVCK